ncbi:uncharacterized protein [Ptychodera flava]|uniref:uncharacterized protein n=1 Tax=Ptychodera flava TaxID=63121 RepID=UPI003969C63D
MSLYQTKAEEGRSILHEPDSFSGGPTQKLVYVYKNSGGKTCMWIVVGLILVIAVVAMTLAIVSYNNSTLIQRTVVFYGNSGFYDSKMSADPAENTERFEMPIQMEHNGKSIVGKAVVVHDFNAGYTAYKISMGEKGICYISKLNRTFIKYDPHALSDFLNDYKDQKIHRDPKFTVTCSPDSSDEVSDPTIIDSPEISETCAGTVKTLFLKSCEHTKRQKRSDTDICLVNIPLWVVDVKLFCADISGIIGGLFQ